MTSVVKNIIGGVLAVSAILGVAALFVDVTRNKGGVSDGELIQEEGRPSWGKIWRREIRLGEKVITL